MPRVLPILSIALGLTTAGCLVYAWQLHGRLAASEATVTANARELARLRSQPASAEHRESFGTEVDADTTTPSPTEAPAEPIVDTNRRTIGLEARNEAEIARRNSPEVRRLMALQRRATLDGRYAALFRSLKLSPADLERFKDLLVDRQSAAMDVFNSAREEGLNPRENREQIRQLIESLESETDASIRATLGETAYQQYQQYEQSFPQRVVVNQVEQRLSYSGTPLYGNQAEQLVNLLAASKQRSNPSTAVTGTASSEPRGGRAIAITDSIIAQSEGFLSQPQVAALRQLQQEQALQADLQQQLRQSRRNNGGATRPPASTGTGP